MKQPTPFDRRATKRVPTRAVRVVLKGAAAPGPHVATDISLEGVGILGPKDLAPGHPLEIELDHKHVGVLSTSAQVAWCRDVNGARRCGLALLSLSVPQRTYLRRIMAAEVGSCVLEDGRVRGFAVSTAAGVWAVFDAGALKVAVVNQEATSFAVTHRPRGAAYEALERKEAPTFVAAVGAVLGTQGALTFDPPIGPRSTPVAGASAASGGRPGASGPPQTGKRVKTASDSTEDAFGSRLFSAGAAVTPAPPPPPAPPAPPAPPPPRTAPAPAPAASPTARLGKPAAAEPPAAEGPATIQGSAVVDGGETIGFVALTGKRTWSVYDPDQQQIAVLSNEAAKFTIFWLGARPEDSLEFLEADSYPAALAAAFDLDHPPQLRSALISPQQRAETAPVRPSQRIASGVRVIFRHRTAGYLRPSTAEGSWTALGKRKEQVAMIAPAGGLWRVCMLGASPEDSLDFDEVDDFLDAVRSAYKLPEAPTLDPPITPAAPPR